MTSHSSAEQEQPASAPSRGDDASVADDADSEIDDEELDNWLVPTYKPKFYSKRPMKKALTAPWGLLVSNADVAKLKTGFKSQSMDHKWDFLVEDPDKNGNTSIHIIRTWCREECWIIHLVPASDDHDGGSAKIESITWEGNKAIGRCDAEQAKKEAVILLRGWLRCEFATLPQYAPGVFYNPKAYTKLNTE
ncbi:hypothetical protein PFICI_13460 [Pestalotiopsis fici W106-1]|uniref:Uncharacterized protein n=1 Tax=Pestalotiopsis fici (strain W106-1 / CGMCC3.15140) TaxID=1229662 RepID=W3WQ70_PESFW|nr:uncharacterized protein PFICI_13460 [Pestalotiopsis fici W106-1]ETS74976.1 hypothetical protein PFICI_13460 [Pestalotiopsis fici W106-1]